MKIPLQCKIKWPKEAKKLIVGVDLMNTGKISYYLLFLRRGLNKRYKTQHQTYVEEKIKFVLGSELRKEYMTKKQE